MTTENFTRYVSEFGDSNLSREVDEEAVKELSQLISGSLVYRLYEALDRMDFDLAAVTAHLEALCDSGNHFGLVYFVLMLAESANIELPERFTEAAVVAAFIPYLSAALIEDWLNFHNEYEGIAE
ncbi:MAG: hypothetical protein LBN30_10140 [Oscillospiraceae bacterium]|jgi:hypothetical protein|nr:hypothetical protein [Oscillospiraceae bacterium]